MDKEQKAKEYAESLTGLDYMGEVEAERAYLSGWDEALKSQWVKVEDRLPKKDERVFVLYKYRGSIMIDTDSYFGENFYNLYGMGKGWDHGGEKIIAWMPIPSFESILQANKDVLMRLKDK